MKLKYVVFPVALLVVLEIILRLLGFCNSPLYYASDQYEYQYAPNQDRIRFGNRVLLNEYSMRSAPLSESDSIRILLIGDSFLEAGVRVSHEHLATTLLEERLTQQFQLPIRVLNVAAKSWGVDNAAAYVKVHGNFNASIICLVFGSADAYDIMTFEPKVGIHPDYPDHQYTFAIVELFDRYLIPRYIVPFLKKMGDADEKDSDKKNKLFDPGWRFFMNYCQMHQIELMVYLHPILAEFEAGEYADDTLENFLIANKVAYISALDTEIKRSYYVDRLHFNELGQQHMANILYPELAKRVSVQLREKEHDSTSAK